MIYAAKWSNLRKEYRQKDARRWSWVDLVDVSVESLSINTTVELPAAVVVAPSDIKYFLEASEDLKKLARWTASEKAGSSFQLSVEAAK